MFKKVFAEILQLIYPNFCAGCNSSLQSAEQVICNNCHKHLAVTGKYVIRNATEKLFLGRLNLMHASSLLYFQKDSISQNLIHALKYNGKYTVASLLGQMMANHIKEAEWPLQNAVLLPVPLSPNRLQKRGYNQSMLIAKAISDSLCIPISNDIIYRIRNTESQTRKDRLERLQNMTDAFGIKNAASFENKHVIIIDDVITSGATIEACYNTLHRVENINISVLCAAIADGNY
jgi:competence protein ComFC